MVGSQHNVRNCIKEMQRQKDWNRSSSRTFAPTRWLCLASQGQTSISELGHHGSRKWERHQAEAGTTLGKGYTHKSTLLITPPDVQLPGSPQPTCQSRCPPERLTAWVLRTHVPESSPPRETQSTGPSRVFTAAYSSSHIQICDQSGVILILGNVA